MTLNHKVIFVIVAAIVAILPLALFIMKHAYIAGNENIYVIAIIISTVWSIIVGYSTRSIIKDVN